MRRTVLSLTAVVLALLAGCAGNILDTTGILSGLGSVVCTAYDFNDDGQTTTDELRQGLAQIYGQELANAFSDEDLAASLDLYGCRGASQ